MEESNSYFEIKLNDVDKRDYFTKIEHYFREIDNIKSVIIDKDDNLVKITVKKDSWTLVDLQKAIGKLGFSISANNERNIVEHQLFKCHVRIQGMTCSSCVHSIEGQVLKLIGVKSALINLLSTIGEMTYDPQLVMPSNITDAINDMGFDAELVQMGDSDRGVVEISIQGMTCSSCVNTIESKLSQIPGILSVKVALTTERGKFKFDRKIIGARDIIDAIEDMGFEAKLTPKKRDKMNNHMSDSIRKWRNSFLVSLIFGIPTMIAMMVFMYGFGHMQMTTAKNETMMHSTAPMIIPGLSLENLLLFLLSTPVQFYGARYFYIQAYKSIKHGSANMDVLIVMATSVSYFYSLIVLIVSMSLAQSTSPPTFFETTPMLIVFLSLGRWLEHIAKGKTSEALSKLLSLQATDATIITENNHERKVAIELVKKGDLIKILPGEKIPIDGRVISGKSCCDESLITGESMSVEKIPGSDVIGGTLNMSGMLIVQATLVGDDSALNQIVKLVEEAQTSKAPIQELADKVAGLFVPAVIICSLITLITWIAIGYRRPDFLPGYSSSKADNTERIWKYAFQLAITVLSVACPCSLGLATPTAVMVGTGVGAVNGILIKGGVPLEKMHQLDVIVFDKTGTITMGKPTVTNFNICVENISDSILKSIILMLGAAESSSEHPIGKAILNYCMETCDMGDMPAVLQSKSVSGFGLECSINIKSGMFIPLNMDVENLLGIKEMNANQGNSGKKSLVEFKKINEPMEVKLLLGNRNMMNTNNISITENLDKLMSEEENRGRTVVLMAVGNILLAMISIADQVKPEAALVVYSLKKMGVEVYLLTGDNHKTATAIAKEVGIYHVFAEVLPSHKVAKIQQIQSMTEHRKSSPFGCGKSSKRKTVAMVGDGINDSPALAQADVGIAIGTGTDVAVEAADVVLIRNSLFDVIAAMQLSKATVRRIRQNFVAATMYNLIGIPIAAGALMPIGVVFMPWMASMAMAASSICVVCLSLMLKLWKKPNEDKLANHGFRQHLEFLRTGDIEIGVNLGRDIKLPKRNLRRSIRSSLSSFWSSLEIGQSKKKIIKADRIALLDDYVSDDENKTKKSTFI